MANRIAGSVYIIESSGSNLSDINMKVNAIHLYSTVTAGGLLELAMASDTTNVVVCLKSESPSLDLGGVSFSSQLYVKSLISGTGYIYFA